MKAVQILYISSLIIGLSGCYVMQSNVTSESKLSGNRRGFVSKAKPEAIPQSFSRVLLVIQSRESAHAYASRFAATFPEEYQVCVVTINPYEPANHAEAIRERALDCQSEVVLTVERTYKGKVLSLDAPEGNDFSQYQFEMRSLTTNQSFWKGVAATNPLSGDEFPPRAIVSRLLRDGVINGQIPDRKLVRVESGQAVE
ncbi:hypothetical protein DYU11_02930 [Fibrisoma montanum]|uniref:Lipoprotein n=1 Tax=Fibrisoma montanum TaxID=2305895 RepID=A0A418MIN3_9BACT|nr:hypothetical protein [Fibrisoma montanum]RIV27282.1 hypothetical protein DYU11_02930 [Fibrisoma montanum]